MIDILDRLYLLYVDRGRDVSGGPSWGTRFDMSDACGTCGTGARQVGPLLLKTFRPPKTGLFLTADDEVLAVEDLADELDNAGFRFLGDVVRYGDGKRLPVRQLIPEADLPKFSEDTTGYEREAACPVCGRDGYFDTPEGPLLLRYEGLAESILNMDLLATYERFGNSRICDLFEESYFASPHYVVSHRLKTFLEEHSVRGLEFLPVTIGQ